MSRLASRLLGEDVERPCEEEDREVQIGHEIFDLASELPGVEGERIRTLAAELVALHGDVDLDGAGVEPEFAGHQCTPVLAVEVPVARLVRA